MVSGLRRWPEGWRRPDGGFHTSVWGTSHISQIGLAGPYQANEKRRCNPLYRRQGEGAQVALSSRQTASRLSLFACRLLNKCLPSQGAGLTISEGAQTQTISLRITFAPVEEKTFMPTGEDGLTRPAFRGKSFPEPDETGKIFETAPLSSTPSIR